MPEPGVRAASEELIEELMGAVVAVDFVLQTLMNLPADALSGDNRAEAIRDLLTTSAYWEVEAIGEEACRAAIALIETVINRMADDARAVAELAEAASRRPC
ncbi:MAG TPA: hypothetical protein VFI03_04335 [Solirubrobacterales bacterium]|nr:hypothetical protein [Solirubrobacterales bacterium]